VSARAAEADARAARARARRRRGHGLARRRRRSRRLGVPGRPVPRARALACTAHPCVQETL